MEPTLTYTLQWLYVVAHTHCCGYHRGSCLFTLSVVDYTGIYVVRTYSCESHAQTVVLYTGFMQAVFDHIAFFNHNGCCGSHMYWELEVVLVMVYAGRCRLQQLSRK